MLLRSGLQTVVSVVYPPRCLACGALVESDFGLCGTCWRDTPFIGGTICDVCGVPLPGANPADLPQCDTCLTSPRPWVQGRAALVYRDTGRRLVLALKHGDRQEIAKPAARWMALVLRDILPENTVIAPVPLHWTRMLKRKYNQSALLAKALAARTGHDLSLDLLVRVRRTRSLDGLGRRAREEMVQGAIHVRPNIMRNMVDRPILLVDDVLTSGATLTAATQACLTAGTGPVRIVTLARVAKDT